MDPRLRASLVGYLINKTGATPELAGRLADHVEQYPHSRGNQAYMRAAQGYQMEQLAERERLRMSLMSGGMARGDVNDMLQTAGYDEDQGQPDATTSADAEMPALQRAGKRASRENAAIAKNPGNMARLKAATDQVQAQAALYKLYPTLSQSSFNSPYPTAATGQSPFGGPIGGLTYDRPTPPNPTAVAAAQLSSTMGIDPALAADTATKLYAPTRDVQFNHTSDKGSDY